MFVRINIITLQDLGGKTLPNLNHNQSSFCKFEWMNEIMNVCDVWVRANDGMNEPMKFYRSLIIIEPSKNQAIFQHESNQLWGSYLQVVSFLKGWNSKQRSMRKPVERMIYSFLLDLDDFSLLLIEFDVISHQIKAKHDTLYLWLFQ